MLTERVLEDRVWFQWESLDGGSRTRPSFHQGAPPEELEGHVRYVSLQKSGRVAVSWIAREVEDRVSYGLGPYVARWPIGSPRPF